MLGSFGGCDFFCVPCTHNRLVVMVIGTIHYHTYQLLARNGPNGEAQFFATAFSDQNLSNRKNNQTNTNQMMGWIENRPNKFFNQNFVRQMLPPKQRCYVLGLPVLIYVKRCHVTYYILFLHVTNILSYILYTPHCTLLVITHRH